MYLCFIFIAYFVWLFSWLRSAQELQTAERVAGAEAALAVAAAALRRWEAHLGDRELQLHISCIKVVLCCIQLFYDVFILRDRSCTAFLVI